MIYKDDKKRNDLIIVLSSMLLALVFVIMLATFNEVQETNTRLEYITNQTIEE